MDKFKVKLIENKNQPRQVPVVSPRTFKSTKQIPKISIEVKPVVEGLTVLGVITIILRALATAFEFGLRL